MKTIAKPDAPAIPRLTTYWWQLNYHHARGSHRQDTIVFMQGHSLEHASDRAQALAITKGPASSGFPLSERRLRCIPFDQRFRLLHRRYAESLFVGLPNEYDVPLDDEPESEPMPDGQPSPEYEDTCS